MIRYLACDSSSDDAANKWRKIDQAGLEGCEIVRLLIPVDCCDRFGEHDEPTDGQGIDEGAPENGGVRKKDERSDDDSVPTIFG